jgi:hypothetical protein
MDLSPEAEQMGDWLREDEGKFLCLTRGMSGERCVFTEHFDNQHSWVAPVPHDHVNPDGSEQTPRRG